MNKNALISCYYNPHGWKSRLDNYNKFVANLDPRIELWTIELSIKGSPFQIPKTDRVVRLTSGSFFWHKERLLNILANQLIAKGYENIVWCDADVRFFHNDDWFFETCEKLQNYKLVVPFSTCSHYERSWGTKWSMPQVYQEELGLENGHPGFVCGMSREVWELGLYDYAIRGSGDACLWNTVLHEDHLLKRVFVPIGETFEKWKTQIKQLVNRDTEISYVNSHVLHFWGGSVRDRQYNNRYKYVNSIDPLVIGYDIIDPDPRHATLEWGDTQLAKDNEQEFYDIMTMRHEDTDLPRKQLTKYAIQDLQMNYSIEEYDKMIAEQQKEKQNHASKKSN